MGHPKMVVFQNHDTGIFCHPLSPSPAHASVPKNVVLRHSPANFMMYPSASFGIHDGVFWRKSIPNHWFFEVKQFAVFSTKCHSQFYPHHWWNPSSVHGEIFRLRTSHPQNPHFCSSQPKSNMIHIKHHKTALLTWCLFPSNQKAPERRLCSHPHSSHPPHHTQRRQHPGPARPRGARCIAHSDPERGHQRRTWRHWRTWRSEGRNVEHLRSRNHQMLEKHITCYRMVPPSYNLC